MDKIRKMYEEELKSLLNRKWSDEEKSVMIKLTDNLMYYKKLVPKSLKHEIFVALQLCNKLKTEFEGYQLMKMCECGGLKKCDSNDNDNNNSNNKNIENEITEEIKEEKDKLIGELINELNIELTNVESDVKKNAGESVSEELDENMCADIECKCKYHEIFMKK